MSYCGFELIFATQCKKKYDMDLCCLPQLEASLKTASQNCEQMLHLKTMEAAASQRGGPRAGQLLAANLGRLVGIEV